MLFKLAVRNSKRSRKENGLFFASLLVSIVAFYVLLSFPRQDVMIFLKRMESDAVNKLMGMVPIFFGMTLFLLFFLIYFASKFQLERRRHEFGVCLMMGMRRKKLFAMLMMEDLQSSMVSLLIGIPIAVLISELISLVTARLVGMGIVGHSFSFSAEAVLATAAGFIAIKFAAFLILSGKIAKSQIGSLLNDKTQEVKKQKPVLVYISALILGIGCLAWAYASAISGGAWRSIRTMGLTVILGLMGTFLLFYGLRVVIGFLAEHGRTRQLHIFNFRQIEENVIHRRTLLAVASLLMLAALCCFGAGVSIARVHGETEPHVLDYTFYEYKSSTENIRETLETCGLASNFSELFEIRIGHIRTTDDYDNAFQMDTVFEALSAMPQSVERDVIINNLGYESYPYLISQSGYNKLLSAAGLPLVELGEHEMAVYMDKEFTGYERERIMNEVLKTRPEVLLDGEQWHLTGSVQKTDIVTDRAISLSFALIIPDDAFLYYTKGDGEAYLDGILDKEAVSGMGLMNAILTMNERLGTTGIHYESYLQNMGRQLFYVVASSYITIYLAVIFLVIANTILGVQFLMGQQKVSRRYVTLVHLGAAYETICGAAKKQINWFFGLPIAVSLVSSMFGVRSLFSGILSSQNRGNIAELMIVSAAMILLLFVIECIYIAAVKRLSSRYLLTLMMPKREE